MKHDVQIRMKHQPEIILESKRVTIRSRLFNWLFGMPVHLLVVAPGDTVASVEIKEMEDLK